MDAYITNAIYYTKSKFYVSNSDLLEFNFMESIRYATIFYNKDDLLAIIEI